MVAFLSGDLMFASKIKGAATSAGLGFHFGGGLPSENTSQIKFVLLDLATRSSLTDKIIAMVEEKCPGAKTIAFGPHVDTEKLEAAKQAGIQHVLSRSQLVHALPTMFS